MDYKKTNTILLVAFLITIGMVTGLKTVAKFRNRSVKPTKVHVSNANKHEFEIYDMINKIIEQVDELADNQLGIVKELKKIRDVAHTHDSDAPVVTITKTFDRTNDLQCPVCGTLSDYDEYYVPAFDADSDNCIKYYGDKRLQLCEECGNIYYVQRDNAEE